MKLFPWRLNVSLLFLGLAVWPIAVAADSPLITTINGPAGEDDAGLGIVVSPGGFIYVVGRISTSKEGQNIWIGKFDKNLVLLSSATVNGFANGFDDATGIVVDGYEDVYVVGKIGLHDGKSKIWVGKFNSNLALQISKELVEGWGSAISIDGHGSIYITGNITNASRYYDTWIARLDRNLILLSSKTITASRGNEMMSTGLTGGPSGGINVICRTGTAPPGARIWVIRFDSELVLVSSRTVGSSNEPGMGWGAISDKTGNIYVTGTTGIAKGMPKVWIGRFSTDLSRHFFLKPREGEGRAIVTDGDSIYVAGSVYDDGAGKRIGRAAWFAKYTSSLVPSGQTMIIGSPDPQDNEIKVKAIAVDSQGRIYATGITETHRRGSADDIWVAALTIR